MLTFKFMFPPLISVINSRSAASRFRNLLRKKKIPTDDLHLINLRDLIVESFCLMITAVSFVASYGPHHPRGAHRHYKPQAGSKLMKDSQLLQDEVHIKEDLSHIVSNPDTQEMSPVELEFHYFKIHDFDNNTKLDGLEILQAIRHTLHNEDGENAAKEMQHYIDLIDRVLEEDDLDRDGYLSYVEYVVGREREKKG